MASSVYRILSTSFFFKTKTKYYLLLELRNLMTSCNIFSVEVFLTNVIEKLKLEILGKQI